MKIGFVYSEKKFSGKLTKFWTNSYAYHCGFVSDDIFYDMHLIRRKRLWADYSHGKDVVLVDCPVPVSQDYLEGRLLSDDNTYGVLDYVLFALRPIYHWLGKSTPNAKGVICSEMVAIDLTANGWTHEFEEVPSPADLENVLL